jgi:ABC-2 type transport system ATP-binding protein
MIKIENLVFSYSKKKLLFDQLGLTLPSGNIYGLLGKNGAGKSTLLKIMSGLLFPKTGHVEAVGFKPQDRDPRLLRETFLVAEEFILPSMTWETYVRLYGSFYPRFSHELFENYIRDFNLPLDQKLTDMSYGQRKSFLLSFGLATDCRLLLMDEPTNGLDIPSKSHFRKIVASAIHEERSFIISTHQVRDMENLIDPILILDEGRIIFFEDLEKVTERLVITKQTEIPHDSRVVYFEPAPGGYQVLAENIAGKSSRISLEILFNAVIGNRERMNSIFNN